MFAAVPVPAAAAECPRRAQVAAAVERV
jgi:hypothetical protein